MRLRLLLSAILVLILAACGGSPVQPTLTPSQPPTQVPPASATPSPAPTLAPTAAPTQTQAATPIPAPTLTPQPQGAHLFQAVLSPKGDLLAVATSDGVLLLGAPAWHQVAHLSAGREIQGVAFVPGNKPLLALATQTGAVEFWDLTTRTQQVAFLAANSASAPLTAVAISPNGHWLAAGSRDNRVYVWDLSTAKLAQTFIDLTGPVTTVTFTPNSQIVAAGAVTDCAANVVLAAWNATTGEREDAPSGVPSTVNAVVYSPNGKILATGGADGIVYLAPLNGDEPLQLSDHSAEITAIAYSPDGKLVASGGADNRVVLWKASTGDELYRLEGHQAPIASLIFLPNTPFLLSASADGDLATWDTTNGTLQKSITLFSNLAVEPVHC